CHKHSTVNDRGCGDEGVLSADRLPTTLQSAHDLSRKRGFSQTKRKNLITLRIGKKFGGGATISILLEATHDLRDRRGRNREVPKHAEVLSPVVLTSGYRLSNT